MHLHFFCETCTSSRSDLMIFRFRIQSQACFSSILPFRVSFLSALDIHFAQHPSRRSRHGVKKKTVLVKALNVLAESVVTQCHSVLLLIVYVRVSRRSYSRITTCKPRPLGILHLRFQQRCHLMKSEFQTAVWTKMIKTRRRTCLKRQA